MIGKDTRVTCPKINLLSEMLGLPSLSSSSSSFFSSQHMEAEATQSYIVRDCLGINDTKSSKLLSTTHLSQARRPTQSTEKLCSELFDEGSVHKDRIVLY